METGNLEKLLATMVRASVDVNVDRESFAWSLKTWRCRQGLTQTAAGKRLGGVSRYTIMRAEKGTKLDVETAYRLFAFLTKELQLEAERDAEERRRRIEAAQRQTETEI